ncbi:MAG: ATP-grasp domain-containing protein, partial [Alphaproteobacteria bacterium]|nr:ATP-grasp domain-containing protein [Alphaproteobacteria bacterium]MDX5493177.1 ATP-grasp domain-containing protein [Alphaproteobacteria bacterium]
MSKTPLKVMIAGIGGASLGTEIAKSLTLAENCRLFGCDISSTAYGLYDDQFETTFLVDRDDYIASVIAACHEAGSNFLLPGGEQPMQLLGQAQSALEENGISLVANSTGIVELFSDKAETFAALARHDVPVPRTRVVRSEEDVAAVGLPCIVKPATGSGGSVSVFFAVTAEEAMIYADFIRRGDSEPIAQEYIGIDEGEFTIGVLSLPDGTVA